jgi:hypothetical protein
MATANPIASTSPVRRRWARRTVLALTILVFASIAWFRQPLGEYAVIGAAYGARAGCSCRFVEGRGFADCRKDFEPGMALVRLSEDAEKKSVTAGIPLLKHQTATFHEGEGCVLEKWAD